MYNSENTLKLIHIVLTNNPFRNFLLFTWVDTPGGGAPGRLMLQFCFHGFILIGIGHNSIAICIGYKNQLFINFLTQGVGGGDIPFSGRVPGYLLIL